MTCVQSSPTFRWASDLCFKRAGCILRSQMFCEVKNAPRRAFMFGDRRYNTLVLGMGFSRLETAGGRMQLGSTTGL